MLNITYIISKFCSVVSTIKIINMQKCFVQNRLIFFMEYLQKKLLYITNNPLLIATKSKAIYIFILFI
jgi:hypothetical protein